VKKRVLLLGGNRSNLLSIRSAKKAGFFTLVADPNPQSPALREADSTCSRRARVGIDGCGSHRTAT